jgi:hypothetical protein
MGLFSPKRGIIYNGIRATFGILTHIYRETTKVNKTNYSGK